jgi:arylsulfatase A-like enzyme
MAAQPNILWIVTTQWRAQSTGYAGDVNAVTPWLDGLASESLDYTNAVTPHPLGPQARAALLTGRLCPENGVRGYWDPLPVYQHEEKLRGTQVPPLGRTVAHALNDRGYVTAFFGKWHLAPRNRSAPFVGEEHAKMIVSPERRGGFRLWEGFESGFLLNDPWLHGTRLTQPRQFRGYQADVLAERAGAWAREQAAKKLATGQPYFGIVSLEAPHPPYHAPAGPTGARQASLVREGESSEITLRSNVPRGGPVEQQAREELAGYYAHIEATDRAIGKLIAEIDLSDTIVVFTSVHGDMHGSQGLFRKAWPYEESVRVPLLIRRPEEGGRKREDASPVSLVDLPHMAVAWAEGREWHCRGDNALISMPSATEIPLQCPIAWRGFRSAKHKLVLKSDESDRAGGSSDLATHEVMRGSHPRGGNRRPRPAHVGKSGGAINLGKVRDPTYLKKSRRAAGFQLNLPTKCRRIVARRSSLLNGLVRKSFMPAAKQCSRSPCMAFAVSATMIGWRSAAHPARMARAASSPSISGICRSMNTRSKARSFTAATASWPLVAVTA